MARDDAIVAEGGLAQPEARQAQAQSDRERMSDQALIRTAGDPGNHMELQRRLRVAVQELTAQIVTFRKSSDAAAKRLEWLTYVLVLMTAVLVALTVILVVPALHKG